MKTLGISLAGIVLLAMGCTAENEVEITQRVSIGAPFDKDSFDFDRSIAVQEGAIYTNLGGYSVNGPAQWVNSEGDAQYLSVEMVRNEADAAMALIGISNLRHPAFTTVGRTTTFREGVIDEEDNDDYVGLTMTACAGTVPPWAVGERSDGHR